MMDLDGNRKRLIDLLLGLSFSPMLLAWSYTFPVHHSSQRDLEVVKVAFCWRHDEVSLICDFNVCLSQRNSPEPRFGYLNISVEVWREVWWLTGLQGGISPVAFRSHPLNHSDRCFPSRWAFIKKSASASLNCSNHCSTFCLADRCVPSAVRVISSSIKSEEVIRPCKSDLNKGKYWSKCRWSIGADRAQKPPQQMHNWKEVAHVYARLKGICVWGRNAQS